MKATPQAQASPHQGSGQLWLAVLGLALMLAGLVFVGVLYTAWQRAEETRTWPTSECLVIASALEIKRPTPNSNLSYLPKVRFEFNHQGKTWVGQRIRRVDIPSQHRDVAQAKLNPYPVGSRHTCFINPAAPQQAILRHDSRAPLYSIWFPCLFVWGGLQILRRSLRRPDPERDKQAA